MKMLIILLVLVSTSLYSQGQKQESDRAKKGEEMLKPVEIAPMSELQDDKEASHILLEKVKSLKREEEIVLEESQGELKDSILKKQLDELSDFSRKYPKTKAALMAELLKVSLFSSYRGFVNMKICEKYYNKIQNDYPNTLEAKLAKLEMLSLFLGKIDGENKSQEIELTQKMRHIIEDIFSDIKNLEKNDDLLIVIFRTFSATKLARQAA